MRFPAGDSNPLSPQTASAAAPADCLPPSAAAPACGSPPDLASSTPGSPSGSRSAAGAPPRSAASSLAPVSPLLPGCAPGNCGNTRLGSLPPTDTSDPHSSCLALASLPGSGRRCLRATASVRSPSRLDFVQGTLQKIHLQHLLRQRSLQPLYFARQRRLSLPL